MISVSTRTVDGIILIDNRDRVLGYSRGCEQLFGHTAAEILGCSIGVILPAESFARHDGVVRVPVAAAAGRAEGRAREVCGRHRDGTLVPLEISAGETVTSAGSQRVGLLRDLRPRRQHEPTANRFDSEALNRVHVASIDEMGLVFAHELNQPLTALILYLHLAKRAAIGQSASGPLTDLTMELFAKAEHEAERAGAIIQRIRRLVERREPLRRPIEFNPLVEEAVEHTLFGRSSRIRVIRSYAPVLPQVEVDPIQIEQIVVNLVRNAIEAATDRTNPEIAVATLYCDAAVELSISDNGPGISPAAVPDLFTPFRSSKGSGLGLGLAISQMIARSHGGDLTADPGGNGRGASFTLHLPPVAA